MSADLKTSRDGFDDELRVCCSTPSASVREEEAAADDTLNDLAEPEVNVEAMEG